MGFIEEFCKARDIGKLVKKTIINKKGKKQTVYVRAEKQTPEKKQKKLSKKAIKKQQEEKEFQEFLDELPDKIMAYYKKGELFDDYRGRYFESLFLGYRPLSEAEQRVKERITPVFKKIKNLINKKISENPALKKLKKIALKYDDKEAFEQAQKQFPIKKDKNGEYDYTEREKLIDNLDLFATNTGGWHSSLSNAIDYMQGKDFFAKL